MKIAITSDTTRISDYGKPVPSHNAATLWFKTLIEPFLLNINDLQVTEILSKEEVYGTHKTAFDTQKLYDICGLEPNSNSWAKIYSSDLEGKVSAKVEEFVLSYYQNYDLVIGFELPDIFIKIFNKHKIPYIDAFIHPVRFYRDIILAFRTNQPYIYLTLAEDKYFFSRKAIYNSTNFERAKLFVSRGLGLQKNSCLFLGQTNVDKSLIEDGEVKSIFEFKDELEALGKKYSKVYYKIHPYMTENVELTDYLKSLDFVEIIDERNEMHKDFNIYLLFAQKSIKKVYSLTSSGCYEAPFFGLESSCFMEYPFKLKENKTQDDELHVFSDSHYVPVKPQKLFTQEFWNDILRKSADDLIDKNLEIDYRHGDLRRAIGKKWGYGFFE